MSHAVAMNGCQTDGEIRLIGLNSTCILAGKVHLCYKNEWRTVCHSQWNRNDVEVVCRQLGFPDQGKKLIIKILTYKLHFVLIGAQACGHSCLGRNDTLKGLYNFRCSGNEHSLHDCPDIREVNRCGEVAGVICCK